ncbi:MAG: hypothetical protein IT320_27055 [Anaerolineae bacterium]|nr:hypothetical protein [Anaerolineae bacterium]
MSTASRQGLEAARLTVRAGSLLKQILTRPSDGDDAVAAPTHDCLVVSSIGRITMRPYIERD